MMHHPNMHHQQMSGHPPQHLAGHQGMPGHHQMQHQMHRENRHVPMQRVAMGPGGGGGGGMSHAALGLGSMVHRAPHPGPPRPHLHAQPPRHVQQPQQLKPMRTPRNPYSVGSYAPLYPAQPPQPAPPPAPAPAPTASPPLCARAPSPPAAGAAGLAGAAAVAGGAPPAPGAELPHVANSKEKTPMCLVNELARYNKIKHQYRLTSETGPAHKKVFTVTLRLGDTEEYTAEGSSIKRAQHAAASTALTQTRYPAPPPRAHVSAHAHHNRHSGTVMPTVELNALAMKLCQPAVYTTIPCVPAPGPPRLPAHHLPAHLAAHLPAHRAARHYLPAHLSPYAPRESVIYRVRVSVGARAWLGSGGTPQAARHDAAARALADLRPAPAPSAAAAPPAAGAGDAEAGQADDDTAGGEGGEGGEGEVKSPVSLVHELALKRSLVVGFAVKSERGPPHMRVFITACTVGELETEGEGNGKKVSKRRAAERMLEEMRARWPPALLRARAPPPARRKPQATKKKPRNLIKESCEGGSTGGGAACSAAGDNPISRLAMRRHAARARSPQYRVLEERGAARRREFLVACEAPPHSATGTGPNKKTAKRRAAHNVLLAMEMGAAGDGSGSAPPAGGDPALAPAPAANSDNKLNNNDNKRKDSEGATGEGRQPVPGVLMMDYHRTQPAQPNGVSESGGNSPGAKDQLMYLSQLLGFTVQFSDFPKRNHGEYLSLVSLSTEPPVMCHGGGATTARSHEQCARAALQALELMGLDETMHSLPAASPGKSGVLSGAAE